ncbi:XRE family transcriptional regulator [Nocardia farcinica]|uniref:XRE family transcriptional regulator n=1 Tax=Nocardia farcinica TaxID=37329 RepID=UPI0024581C61|nr:XRE family transcriptional regulator [Nocardia farcinica]
MSGFNHRMVTLAREAAGLTQTALAHQVGISQAFISKIENGFEEPTRKLQSEIANACGVPPEFFEQEEGVLGESLVDLYHKKRLTLPAKPLRKANAIANVCRNEATRLLRTVEFDSSAPFPDFPIHEYESPEEVARRVRALWRIPPGPLPNLIALIEATGVPVYIVDLEHEKLSAMSMPGPGGIHVIVLNRRLPASARRFALAHELGHLVMHAVHPGDDMEREADQFAAELLMPASDIKRELMNLRFSMLGGLKMKWRVSFAALIRQADSVGAIPKSRYKALNVELSELPNGRKREPGEFPAEEPRFIRKVIEFFESDLGYTRKELEKLLIVTADRLASEYYGEQVGPKVVPVNRRPRNLMAVR